MTHLAALPPETRARRLELGAATGIPACFLGKILQRLATAGLVRSYRGRCGGVRLRRPAACVSMLEVVEAIEGPIAVGRAVETGRVPALIVQRVWGEARGALVGVLAAESIAGLAARAIARPCGPECGT